MRKTNSFQLRRPPGLTIVALLMFLFGLAEVVTGFRHNFFGLTTAQNTLSTYAGVALGLLYILSGVFILPLKKWGAVLAILCLTADIAGRVAMVWTGLFPIDSSKQIFAIIVGTLIAGIFTIFIVLRWKSFQ
jgi:hypothetical protein